MRKMDTFEKISEVLGVVFVPVKFGLHIVEKIMFVMILLYDSYCYTPLQKVLSPIVAKIPRTIPFGNSTVTVFTANIVSWSRTLLVIPIAICLKYGYTTTACTCVILHDFLDHLDGIVAKTHKHLYGEIDDPLLGGFLDAFCDKIVICLSLWTILLTTDFSLMTTIQTSVFLGLCSIIISYEFVLGGVRVQDYFAAYYQRKSKDEGSECYKPNIAASMEGKLKEKLESIAVACLCLCQSSKVPILATSGITGVLCLGLSIRLAHASLLHKLAGRQAKIVEDHTYDTNTNKTSTQEETIHCPRCIKRQQSVYDDLSDDSSDEKSDFSEKEDARFEPKRRASGSDISKGSRKRTLSRSMSVASWAPSNKVDKVYTIGCFDLFHEGHEILLKRLKQIGTQVIVGVHDSRSIFKLKKKVPIDGTSKRMTNVKTIADIVFCVHGTDPSPYIHCIFDHSDGVSSMYVRGDDMQNFPSRDITERLMPIHFLPYTPSVSSTKLRKEIYNASRFGPHVKYDDHTMFY